MEKKEGRKSINSELWHACAGPLVSLPPEGSLVVYFPQGHIEQVAASLLKEMNSIPNYLSLPSKLICVLHNVTLHADSETDEVYAEMTLQPANEYDSEALVAPEMGLNKNKKPTLFFCKTLTTSDTSTHSGFSVPRKAADSVFLPLDFTLQPPARELEAKDLHDVGWKFRHIYRGQPKRHLLTTGWSLFISTKKLFPGDSILFIRDDNYQLLLGIRRASRQQPTLSSSVISNDSICIGILAAAAHAASNYSPFTIFYNPRTSPSEFVIPLAKYNKALCTEVSLGVRFRMKFETEECGVRHYMGVITGISDLDPVCWKTSPWHNIQVCWDESQAADRPTRVSLWEIEPAATPFYLCPPFFRNQPGGISDEEALVESASRSTTLNGDDFGMKIPQNQMFPGLCLVQRTPMLQNSQPSFSSSPALYFPSMAAPTQDSLVCQDQTRLSSFQFHASSPLNIQSGLKLISQTHQPDQHLKIQQLNSAEIEFQRQQHKSPNLIQLQQQLNHHEQLQAQEQQILNQTRLLNEQLQPSTYQIPQQHAVQRENFYPKHGGVTLNQSSLQSPILLQSHSQIQQLVDQQQPSLFQKQQSQITSKFHQIFPSNQIEVQQNPQLPPCSTSPFSSLQVTICQEFQSKQDHLMSKGTDYTKNYTSMADQFNASSTSSFYPEGSSQEGFSLSSACLNGDTQSDPYSSLLTGTNFDSPFLNAILSKEIGSGNNNQYLLSSYCNLRDVDTDSTAAVSSQSFSLQDNSFTSCSGDACFCKAGSLTRGMRVNQQQCTRTYTKVQMRGSIGRSVDVTRYGGYDELRSDLAFKFGIVGQLEDPHSNEWKLVYVDHENDILLVGDDPWEEFVSCVQSIKIISSMEVQQMSLVGDLQNVAAQNRI